MQRHLAAILAADIAGYSGLMADDEAGTLAALKSCITDIIEPSVVQHHGRIFKTMGDGFLVEFASVVEAVACAGAIQRGMAARNLRPGVLPMLLRIGVHLGDVIAEGDDVFGDGVNIAARIQTLAEAGGIRISRQAYDQVEGRLGVTYRALGEQTLKNIPRPVGVYAAEFAAEGEASNKAALEQKIKYCRAKDGTRLAYATVGQGPPLVKTANWMNHLEYDWESPIWSHLLHGLAQDHTLVRYDARGNGMSDWDVEAIDFEAWVSDLETVVDAAELDRFPLLGVSQGCSISIAYAVRHPERVSHLILYGGFAVGRNHRNLNEEQRETLAAMRSMIKVGWGKDNPMFRQVFTSLFVPGGTHEQADSFNELQRKSASPECAVRYWDAVGDINVADLLPRVKTPTLVMHVREDGMTSIDYARQMAAGITGARFVAMPGKNHLFLAGEPAAERFAEEVRLFLAE